MGELVPDTDREQLYERWYELSVLYHEADTALGRPERGKGHEGDGGRGVGGLRCVRHGGDGGVGARAEPFRQPLPSASSACLRMNASRSGTASEYRPQRFL